MTTLRQLAQTEWVFIPAGDALLQCDDATRRMATQMLSDFRGWLCAVCKTSICDDSSTILLHWIGDSNVNPYIICPHCRSNHSDTAIIEMGKSEAICNAVRVAK